MKRFLLILAGLALAAAAAWTGAWFWAKGKLNDGIDARLATLAESHGLDIAYESLETGGFPFAVEARFSGLSIAKPDWAATLRIEEAVSAARIFAPGTVETRLPPLMQIDLTHGDDSLTLDVVSEALVLTSSPGEMALAAGSITFVAADPNPQRTAGFEMAGIRLTSTAPPGAPVSTEATLDSAGFFAVFPAMQGTRAVIVDWQVEGIRLTTQGTLRDEVDAEMLINGVGRLAAGLDAGASDMLIEVSGATAEESFRVGLTQSRILGTLELEEGQLALTGSTQEIAANLVPAAASGTGGGIAIPRAEGRLSLPLAPSDDFSRFALALTLDGIAGDADFWAAIDPERRLARDPGQVIAEIDGTARITRSFASVLPGQALPVEFGNIAIRIVELRLLGAEARLTGDIDVLQPLNLPQGLATLSLIRALETAEQLAAAGRLDAATLDALKGFAGLYTRPGPRPGELITDFELGPTGLSANGEPLGLLE